LSTYFDRKTVNNLDISGGLPDVILIDFYKDENFYRSSITNLYNEKKVANITYTDVTGETLDDVVRTTIFAVSLLFQNISSISVLYDLKEAKIIKEINLVDFVQMEEIDNKNVTFH
jgi:hypothetical protein